MWQAWTCLVLGDWRQRVSLAVPYKNQENKTWKWNGAGAIPSHPSIPVAWTGSSMDAQASPWLLVSMDVASCRRESSPYGCICIPVVLQWHSATHEGHKHLIVLKLLWSGPSLLLWRDRWCLKVACHSSCFVLERERERERRSSPCWWVSRLSALLPVGSMTLLELEDLEEEVASDPSSCWKIKNTVLWHMKRCLRDAGLTLGGADLTWPAGQMKKSNVNWTGNKEWRSFPTSSSD